MSESGHDLRSVFPGDTDVLNGLKLESSEFRALAARYHDVSRMLHRIEANLDAASDERVEELKKERLVLLDRAATLIAARKAA